jgi:hypothetical protein
LRGGGRFSDDTALEELPPLGGDARGVPEELLIEGLRESRVGCFEDVRIHALLQCLGRSCRVALGPGGVEER